jgi:arylsulfatase A-like enzyme
MPAWDDIPEAERPFQRRLMEVAAGFGEHVDVQVGRLLDEVEALGYLDNTVVFYIWGDNGSSGARVGVQRVQPKDVRRFETHGISDGHAVPLAVCSLSLRDLSKMRCSPPGTIP